VGKEPADDEPDDAAEEHLTDPKGDMVIVVLERQS
jgi:hypothetical protein